MNSQFDISPNAKDSTESKNDTTIVTSSIKNEPEPSTTEFFPNTSATIPPSKFYRIQEWLSAVPSKSFTLKNASSLIHVDGGANSHIFRDRQHFWKYVPTKSVIQQVSGSPATCLGIGIVLVRFPRLEHIFSLFPCYHMPENPQDTLGLPPLKFYNQARSTRLEALSWLRVVHKNGSSSMMS